MTTRPYSSRSGRSGFTLVELLVVITVIGLLVGMLVAAVIPVITRARETAIQFEMKQIEQSIENFRNDHGFYPPTWNAIEVVDNPVASANNLLRYINRIAPNNREGAGAPGSRPVDDWWAEVGVNIDSIDGEDLVFWLSGLSKNLQFPLTNGTGTPNAYEDGTFERQRFYEFEGSQLEITGKVAGYNQAAGSQSPWLYVDSANYAPGGAYHILDTRSGMPVERYENPNTFQLFCGGIDKMRGDAVDGDDMPFVANPRQWGVLASGSGFESVTNLIDRNPEERDSDDDGFEQYAAQSLATSDNICNFCEGRLELLTNGSRESLTTQ